MKVSLLGAPGCGKGTQAKLMRDHYHLVHVSTGDLFREAIANDTPLGREIKKYMSTLVPDEIVVRLLMERLNQKDCQEKGFVLDGFPRTINQADILSQYLELGRVIYFDIDLEETKKRILNRRTCKKCGAIYTIETFNQPSCQCGGEVVIRDEDKKVEERIKTYVDNTHPLVAYYEKKGLLSTINANKYQNLPFEQGREAVFNEVRKIMEG